MQRQEAIEAVSLARRGRESWLRLVETDRIASVDYARPLGDGAFCETLRAKLDGDKEVALRVVKSCSKREVLKELKQVVSISGVAVEVFGIAVVPAEKVESDKHLVCLVLELCAHGNLDDFVASHNEAIDLQGRVSIVLGVLERLTKLKEHKVVWRDLKGQNMLVRDYTTRDGRVKEVDFVFSDWGTAISLSKEPNRRMTLNGPGTDGYIAPETKCPQYSYSVDMFAFLVWACSICLDLDKVRPTPLPLLSPLSPLLPSPPRTPNHLLTFVLPSLSTFFFSLLIIKVGPGELEFRISGLEIHKRPRSPKVEEAKIKAILKDLLDRGQIRSDCVPLYTFLVNGCFWVDVRGGRSRWTCEEAMAAIRAEFEAPSSQPPPPPCLSPSSGFRSLSLSIGNTPHKAKDKENRKTTVKTKPASKSLAFGSPRRGMVTRSKRKPLGVIQ